MISGPLVLSNQMKKILGFLIVALTLVSLVSATLTITWDDEYTDDNGVKTLAGKTCSASSADWTTIAWTDDTANVSHCADTARCRGSENNQDWDTYSAWVTTGNSVALAGTYLECQWNLSPTDQNTSNCSTSGFNAICGGYHSTEGYSATDFGSTAIDLGVGVVVAIVALGSILGLVLVWGFVRKKAGF